MVWFSSNSLVSEVLVNSRTGVRFWQAASSMVGIIVLVVCASAEPAGVVSSGLQSSSAKARGAAQTSIRKGVYTKAQAARGHEIYTRECSGSCHEEDLLGQDCVPPLVGPTFFSKWSQRSVGELFEKTQQSMPQT